MISRFLLAIMTLVSVACSPEASQQYFKPNPPEEKVEEGAVEELNQKVDILFIVDNSASMDSHQRNLSANMSLFTSGFMSNQMLDFHIGSISSEPRIYGSAPCCGQLFGNPRVVSKSTHNVVQAIQRNVVLGTSGGGQEMFFYPLKAALTEPLLSGHNAGFYRQGASLVVIFITDAEDQSTTAASGMSPQQIYDFLLQMKKGDRNKVLGYGAIIPTGISNCARDDSWTTPQRIEEFLGLVKNTGNNIMSLCDPQYGQRLAELGKDLARQLSRVIYLKRSPDMASIKVTLGTAVLPNDAVNGWSYHPAKNAIVIGDGVDFAAYPPTAQLKVFYNAAQYDEEKPGKP